MKVEQVMVYWDSEEYQRALEEHHYEYDKFVDKFLESKAKCIHCNAIWPYKLLNDKSVCFFCEEECIN